jgi:hypothetical protein
MHLWMLKVVNWTLFTHTVLGVDFASELVVYYKDRGSYLFNNMMLASASVGGSGSVNDTELDEALPMQAKYVAAVWLRSLRIQLCTALLASVKGALESGVEEAMRTGAVADLCRAVLQAEKEHLERVANIQLRLQGFERALQQLESSGARCGVDVWEELAAAFASVTDQAFGPRVKRHLLDNVTLHELWLMETQILVSLCRRDCLEPLVEGLLGVALQGRIQFVSCVVEMVCLAGEGSAGLAGDAASAALVERSLKDLLQLMYRDCSPSDWAEVSFCVSSVNGLVLTKDNWSMHYKFPGVALLSATYNIIKGQVTAMHGRLCPPQSTTPNSSSDNMLLPNPFVAYAPALANADLLRTIAWVRVLQRCMDTVYLPLLRAVWDVGMRPELYSSLC